LTIRGFKPSTPVDRPLHAEWPIALELDGAYHDLAAFFDRVGKFTRIINITALEVKAKEKPTPGSTITVSCVATTFVLAGNEKATMLTGRMAGVQLLVASAAERTAKETHAYDAGGRRDPFISLLGSGVEPSPAGKRAEGAAGLALAEISVRGVMQGRGATI